MSNPSPYDKLGVAESASFEEIQGMRDRLLREYAGDPKKCAEVEASYDSVLMQRLKLRQEGKIKIPDGIRYAEKTPTPSLPKLTMPSLPGPGSWLSDSFSSPEMPEAGIATAIAVLLGIVVAMNPVPATVQLVAGFATGSALYGIYRKDRSLGRAVVFGLGGLIGGYLLGAALWSVLPMNIQTLVPGGAQAIDVVVSWSVILLLWLVSLFVK